MAKYNPILITNSGRLKINGIFSEKEEMAKIRLGVSTQAVSKEEALLLPSMEDANIKISETMNYLDKEKTKIGLQIKINSGDLTEDIAVNTLTLKHEGQLFAVFIAQEPLILKANLPINKIYKITIKISIKKVQKPEEVTQNIQVTNVQMSLEEYNKLKESGEEILASKQLYVDNNVIIALFNDTEIHEVKNEITKLEQQTEIIKESLKNKVDIDASVNIDEVVNKVQSKFNEQQLDAMIRSNLDTLDWVKIIDQINNDTSKLFYVHEQETPERQWVITHPLGYFPSVTVVDSAETQVYGEVNYVSDKTIHLIFSAPFSGKAYLN